MVTDPNGDEWLTPGEAADYLGLAIGTIYHYKNHLTHRKGASRVFFLKSTLFDDYMSMIR